MRFRLATVNRSDPTLLHEQVAIELRRAISAGEAEPGDRMPQAKDLAAVLGVNTNTVLKALRLLRDQGLLEVGRGRGIKVAVRIAHPLFSTDAPSGYYGEVDWPGMFAWSRGVGPSGGSGSAGAVGVSMSGPSPEMP